MADIIWEKTELTTIKVHKSILSLLQSARQYRRESYEDIIRRLITTGGANKTPGDVVPKYR